jgi:hypothetical protein
MSRSPLHLALLYPDGEGSDVEFSDPPLVGHADPALVAADVIDRHVQTFYDQLNAGTFGQVDVGESGPQMELLLDYFDPLDLGYVTFNRAQFIWADPR